MTLVKWPMMSFGNVKDISKVLIWFVMYFFCYSPTDFFAFFCWSCCLLHFYQLTEKCVTSGSKGGAIIKFQFQVSVPRKDFRLPLFDPYLWSLTIVPLCTVLWYLWTSGRKRDDDLCTFHLVLYTPLRVPVMIPLAVLCVRPPCYYEPWRRSLKRKSVNSISSLEVMPSLVFDIPASNHILIWSE